MEERRNGKSAATGISTRGQKSRIHHKERHAGNPNGSRSRDTGILNLAKWNEVLRENVHEIDHVKFGNKVRGESTANQLCKRMTDTRFGFGNVSNQARAA